MKPTFAAAGLKKTTASEYLLRFAFGGLVTVATGLIAQHFGAAIGGLFLAFPAILPASLTLVTEHDGRTAALADARGARIGSVALAAFAAVIWCFAMRWNGLAVLLAATIVWLIVAVVVWWITCGKPVTRQRVRSAVRSP